jgi:putative aminopeptidase FrvX
VENLLWMAWTPTAPYREHALAEQVRWLAGLITGATVTSDRWGNIAVRIRRGVPQGPPWALVAHLDHPGFLVDGPPEADGRVPVLFEGYVEDEFFTDGRIKLFREAADGHFEDIPAKIIEMGERTDPPRRNRRGWVMPEIDATGATLGMWDLTPVRREEDIIHGRNIDDLAGVAMILDVLDKVSESREMVDVIGLFTRAEEAGFRGALLLCQDPERERLLPNNARVVSVEMSSARPHIDVGAGAVLRVGDRRTVFDAEICQSIEQISERVGQIKGRRPLRRALMDGGSCEATAFNQFGYRAGGVCLPLGNYHNMDKARRRIAEEFISVQDAEDLASVLTELCLSGYAENGALHALRDEFVTLAEDARKRLIGG